MVLLSGKNHNQNGRCKDEWELGLQKGRQMLACLMVIVTSIAS